MCHNTLQEPHSVRSNYRHCISTSLGTAYYIAHQLPSKLSAADDSTDAVTPRPTRSPVVHSSRRVCQYIPMATERELAPLKSVVSNMTQ